MNKTDVFSEYHPSANFLYFVSVITFTMLNQHPVLRLISLFCAVLYYLTLFHSEGKRFILKFVFPVILLMTLVNPLLSHQGKTILFYLPSGNPFTMESVFYGLSSGVLLASVMLWFFCLSAVMTTDKFICLFAQKAPSLSLLLSMTIRFIPLFRKRFRDTADIMYASSGGKIRFHEKISLSVRCFVSVISHCLERGVETSDSMKSRGYGTGKRTAFKNYSFDDRDKPALFFIISVSFFLICTTAGGFLYFRYYPDISGKIYDTLTVISFVAFSSLCLMPIFLERRERNKWKRLKSEI